MNNTEYRLQLQTTDLTFTALRSTVNLTVTVCAAHSREDPVPSSQIQIMIPIPNSRSQILRSQIPDPRIQF